MKRIFVLFAAVIAASLSMSAQNPLPTDPDVKKGQLDNGLTYYIRHNDKPAGRAEFYLATHAGAIQEAPDQDGLAHFLEHMCFNGLKNLPGKQMLEYLQKIGAEFGRNINAQTGEETTSYMLNNIPVIREGIIDTCLLVMHDYSHFVTCDPAEIDKERGVIIEEKRMYDSDASYRITVKSMPYLFGSSKYANCTVIGSQENLESFRPESLVNFYHTWYRPDLQAVIVVGDIDPDQIEAKIKDLFSDIPAAENPREKIMHQIPDNEDPVAGIITDPEASKTEIAIYWKDEPDPVELNNTDQGFYSKLLKNLIRMVMYERFSDITAKPDAPFLDAGLGIYNLTETCEVIVSELSCKDGEGVEAFRALYTELEKMRRFGFTDAEVLRAKENIIRAYEKKVEGADSRKNNEFVNYYINNFFYNRPYMTPEDELQAVQTFFSLCPVPALKRIPMQLISDPMKNVVIIYSAPEKEGLEHPSEDDLIDILFEVADMELEPNKEEVSNDPLLDPAKLKGSAVKKEVAGIHGSTEWTLKNGIKVVVLPTEYKKDQVIVRLSMDGGTSLISDEDLFSFESKIFSSFLNNTGVSKFSNTQLSKMLAGKSVRVRPYFAGLTHGISAVSSPKDLETAMQLLYLQFTDPRFNPDEFKIGINQLSAELPNQKKQPNFILTQEIKKTLFGNNPRRVTLSEETLEKASLATVEKVYRQLFKDAAGATVYIVGNVDLATLRPMVEKYIGSLPKGKKAFSPIEEKIPLPVKGKYENVFETPMQNPMNTVLQVWNGDITYSTEKDMILTAAGYILQMAYTDSIREEEGGSYSPTGYIEISRLPHGFALIESVFLTNPDQVDKLRALSIKVLEDLANDGPTEEQVTRAIENAKKKGPEQRITNNYWLGVLETWQKYNEDEDADNEAAIASINAENIKAALQEVLAQGNFIEVVMGPKVEETEE